MDVFPRVDERILSLRVDIAQVLASEDAGATHNSVGAKQKRLQRERNVRIHRFALIILNLLHSLALLIPALALSNEARETNREILRTTCIAIALVINLAAPVVLMGREIFAAIGTQILFSIVSLMFEMAMFAIVGQSTALFSFGIVSVGVTLLKLIIASVAQWTNNHIAPETETEEFYTVFASETYYQQCAEKRKTVEALVLSRCHGEIPMDASTRQYLVMSTLNDIEGLNGTPRPSIARAETEPQRSPTAAAEALIPNHVVIPTDLPRVGAPRWKTWHAADRIRHTIIEREGRGILLIKVVLVFFFLLVVGQIIYEFLKLFSNQPPQLSASTLKKFKDTKRTRQYMPTRTHSTWKVHLVVIDGLREDLARSGASDLGDYLASPAIAPHSLYFSARGVLPSFSVPNWATILTGAMPEMHGVTGNLLNSETYFDHIFRQAKLYGLHTGISGTPWWRDLVFSTLPSLDGDGTIEASFQPENGPTYNWTTSNPADEARLTVSLKAIGRSTYRSPFGPSDVSSFYDFFLTHFSDVDQQGHKYGIDKEWNTKNTYMKAISNKTAALQQIVAALDTNTVLVVTSDHGHVQRGGHGGVSSELRSVPLVFYTKGRTFPAVSTIPTPAFGSDTDAPKVNFDGGYSTLDISGTIAALLGIPCPRQSSGAFVEEVVQTLVPNAVLPVHYHDIAMSRLAAAEAYATENQDGLFSDEEHEGVLASSGAWNNKTAPSNTAAEYGDIWRSFDEVHEQLRTKYENYAFYRNLVCSIVVLFPWLIFLGYTVNKETLLRFSSANSNKPIMQAMVAGFLTVAAFFMLSIAIFIVGYFAITGYNVWDSTLTHSPDVAQPYLQRTIVGPVIVYILLTKLYLARTIRWNIFDIGVERRRGVTLTAVLRWLTYVGRDIWTIVWTTDRYKPDLFLEAYLYMISLSLWTLIATLVLLFLCFPFTFAVPVVLSTYFVDDFNLEWRFRIITMLLILSPLLLGCVILLQFSRPTPDRDSLQGWDICITEVQMAPDLSRLAGALANARALEHDSDEYLVVEQRIHLLQRCMDMLQSPLFKCDSGDLHHSDIFEIEAPPLVPQAPLAFATPLQSGLGGGSGHPFQRPLDALARVPGAIATAVSNKLQKATV
jgi:hypothetical protein